MKKNFKNSNTGGLSRAQSRGFTIVETLVAIAILVTSVIGTMSAIQTGLSSYVYSKDQIIAFYLAQEGFEQIRNMRDENRLNGRDWLYGLAENSDDPCYFGNACTVSPIGVAPYVTECPSPGSCPKLRQLSDSGPFGGFYGYFSDWTETVFRREVELTRVEDHEVAITVTVNWTKGAAVREFRARENLLNW